MIDINLLKSSGFKTVTLEMICNMLGTDNILNKARSAMIIHRWQIRGYVKDKSKTIRHSKLIKISGIYKHRSTNIQEFIIK